MKKARVAMWIARMVNVISVMVAAFLILSTVAIQSWMFCTITLALILIAILSNAVACTAEEVLGEKFWSI